MASEVWHEAFERLTPATQDLHRALQSVKEELDAVDWYQQRIDASADAELKSILSYIRDEEKEHASMLLEWLRRHNPHLGKAFETYLFTEGEVTAVEEEVERAKGKGGAGRGLEEQAQAPAPGPAETQGFTVGGLKK